MARWLGVLMALLLLAVPATLVAADKALAETLFIEGKELMKQRRVEEACKRFKASHQAEPSVGALLNLAKCHQELGKIASAWSEYKEAAGLADRLNQPDRKEGALEYAAALEPRLSKVTITVETPVQDQVVRYGDTILPDSSYGSAIPIDPGSYSVVASAPGHESWTGELTVGSNGDAPQLTVPALVPSAAPAPETGLHPRTIAGFVIAGVGVASLAVGIAFGVIALNDKDDLDQACQNKRCGPGEGQDQLDAITVKANVSTAMITIGGAALIAGAVLVLTAPGFPMTEVGIQITPVAGPEVAGVGVSGSF